MQSMNFWVHSLCCCQMLEINGRELGTMECTHCIARQSISNCVVKSRNIADIDGELSNVLQMPNLPGCVLVGRCGQGEGQWFMVCSHMEIAPFHSGENVSLRDILLKAHDQRCYSESQLGEVSWKSMILVARYPQSLAAEQLPQLCLMHHT